MGRTNLIHPDQSGKTSLEIQLDRMLFAKT